MTITLKDGRQFTADEWPSSCSCDNFSIKPYNYYGGRGIMYCTEWETFANFYRDMFASWQPGLELDRKDNDKGYDKNNCRWAGKTEGRRNRRNVQLTLEKADILCKAYAEGRRTIKGLAIEQGLTYDATWKAIHGITWKR